MGEKRGNDNAQMSKEDYEALEQRVAKAKQQPQVRHGMERATDDTLKRRRVVRARRPADRSATEEEDGGTQANPFANLPKAVPAAAAKSPFNFGTSATAATAASGLFSFSSSSATAVNTTTNAFTKPNAVFGNDPPASAPSNKHQEDSMALEKQFKKKMQNVKGSYLGASLEKSIIHSYFKIAAEQIAEYGENKARTSGSKEDTGGSKPPALATGAQGGSSSLGSFSKPPANAAPSVTAPAPSTFGMTFAAPPAAAATTTSSSASTPAPATTSTFQFGTGAPAPATTGGFKFGQTTTTASTPAPASAITFGDANNSNDSSSAPAPAQSGGFVFGSPSSANTPAPAAAPTQAPTPAGLNLGGGTSTSQFPLTTSGTSTAPAPAATGSVTFAAANQAAANQAAVVTATDEEAAEDNDPPIMEAVDEGWDDLDSFDNVKMYQKKDPKKNDTAWVQLAQGKVRLQQSTDKKSFRLILRNQRGAVMANFVINDKTKPSAFEKPNSKNTGVNGFVQLVGVNKAEIGPQIFMTMTRKEAHDKLFACLQSMVSQASGK